jgi:hypothetical protein
MKRVISLGVVLAAGMLTTAASAGVIDASAVWSSKLDTDGVHFDYTIVLTNSSASTDPIGTFWFSWVPGKDFMTNSPLSETTPSGWTANITHGGATDGFAIQWVAGSAAADVAIGSSLTFGFVSSETPAQLMGNSQFYPTFPEGTAFLYNAAPFSADSEQIVATPVPEPSTLALSLVGGLGLLATRRFRRRASRS